MLQLQKKQEEVDHAGVPDVAALLRAARELPHLQLQGDAQDLRHELCSSPAAPAAAQAGAAPAPTHQVPLVSGLVLADGRVVSLPPAMQQQLLQQLAIMAGDPVTSAASAGTAGPPELQVLAGSSGGSGGSSSSITTIPGRARAQQQDKAQPAASSRGPLQLPSCSTATHSMAAEAACAAASTSGRGRGLRGENMRHKRCSGQYRETMSVWPQRGGQLGGQALSLRLAQGGTATGPQRVRPGRQHVRAAGAGRAVCHAGARHVRGGSTGPA
jgi:hypothetical protein